MGFKKKLKKIIEKKKIDNHAHARENAKDLRGSAFGLHPQARKTRRKFHQQIWKIQRWYDRILTKSKPQYTQITQYKRDIVILQLQQQQSCSPKIQDRQLLQCMQRTEEDNPEKFIDF